MGLYMFGWMYAPQAAWANMQMAFPHSSDTIYYKSDCIVTPQITERVKARRWINMATSMSKSENNITLCKNTQKSLMVRFFSVILHHKSVVI